MHLRDPPDDFRQIPIIPTIDEILTPDDSFLRPNKTAGAYNSADHYLDVQFRLLREDFLRPLKNGIQEFRKNKREYLSRRKRMPFETVRLYQKIRITNVELVRDTIMYTLQLQPEDYARVKWDRSRRLLNGSLLLFTSDNFTSAYFGIIARREPEELKTKGIFGITWEGVNKPDFSKKNEEFLMFESECFFEAYRHTLQVLKDINLEQFPMAKYIVGSSAEVGPPKYLKDSLDMMKIGESYISALDGEWPSAEELKLDQTQFTAYHAALTREFAIIQGPPGAGKTFLGLRVVETLLRNPQHWWLHGGGPILVVCLTNHALDQFLEGILKLLRELEPSAEPGLIRVGGRSKSEVLGDFTLAHRRMAANKMHMHDRTHQMEKNRAWRHVKNLEGERSDLMSEYLGLANPAGILNFFALSIWPALKEEYPDGAFYVLIQNPVWYGLSLHEFHNPDFNVDTYIRQSFKILQKPKEKPKPAPQRPQQEDDEYYDLEELQANRIMDDVYFQAEFKEKGRGEQHHSKDLEYKISISSLARMVREKNHKGSEEDDFTPHNLQPPVQNNQEKIEARNKLKFLEAFLKLVGDERIELPQIGRVENHLWPQVPPELAWAVYFKVVDRARTLVARALGDMDTRLLESQRELQRIQRRGDGFLLQSTKVVGMTTTAASKASDLLESMKSKIVIVEEAAEVLEAHVLNCITKHCEHLIMIGDHQQLRPSITVLELASKYHLNISLFERMVNNKLNCYKLAVQHRMRPEISDLVRGTIYNELEDHPSVLDFPKVLGLAKNLFFISHKHAESSESDSVTKTNTHEAKFLVGLCKYLVLQGYKTSNITILATYTGQMFLLKKELSSAANCKGVHVTAVDNFQGEENHIILLSLVRSNNDNNVGFLKVDNRICVALSRARHGLYIIGNMDGLVASSPTWKKIQKKLIARGEIGSGLPLLCQTHGTTSTVTDPVDFAKFPEGGCTIPCGKELPLCSHPCKSLCHPKGLDHMDKKCVRPCDKKCSLGHPCQLKCFQQCKPCPSMVEKMLPCSHTLKVECHRDVASVFCHVPVAKRLPCGHKEELQCHVRVESVKCAVRLEKRLPCTHTHILECHEDPTSFKCGVQMTKLLACGHSVPGVECWKSMADYKCAVNGMKRLDCGHEQEALCHVPVVDINCEAIVPKRFENCDHQIDIVCHEKLKPLVCRQPCDLRLNCGHSCTRICHPFDDASHLFFNCQKLCVRKCKRGHSCKQKHTCSLPCPPCFDETKKFYPCKIHTTQAKCSASIKDKRCTFPCLRIHLDCPHKCEAICHEPQATCPPCQVKVTKVAACRHPQEVACTGFTSAQHCKVLVKSYSQAGCGHYSEVPCGLRDQISQAESSKYCAKPCGTGFDESEGGCDHTCKGTCSECQQGRLHKKCGEECGRTLVCGHVCSTPCAENCPPCTQVCGMRCDHSRCKKQCGVPCEDCAEPCNWKCEHKKCTKLCREMCDREPCDEPCRKTLRCGHPCIGLCGEKCPPICRTCNPTKLVEFILYGNEEDADSRFIYLEDCKHSIEVDGMDYYMKNDIEEGQIQAKNCPRCKTPIRHSKRYGIILRKRLVDVMTVKRKVYGNEAEVKKKQASLIAELSASTSNWSKFLPRFRQEMLDKVASVLKESGFFAVFTKDKIVPKNIDQYTWNSVELMVKHGRDALVLLAESDRELSPNFKVDLGTLYTKLFENLSKRNLPLSKMEIRDFDREFGRLFDLKQLYRLGSSQSFTINRARVTTSFDQAKKILFSPTIYDDGKKGTTISLLKEIDKLLMSGIGISEREKREVMAAMGMRQGHWYKCPNGHVYVITECGGAMVESKCNECGAPIGGGSHRLRTDNALATEMDGARAPAWPTNLQR